MISVFGDFVFLEKIRHFKTILILSLFFWENIRFPRKSNVSFPVFVISLFECTHIQTIDYKALRATKKCSCNLSTRHDQALCKQPLSFDDGKKFSPAKNSSHMQRLQTRSGPSISSDIEKWAKCFRHEAKKQQRTTEAASKWWNRGQRKKHGGK